MRLAHLSRHSLLLVAAVAIPLSAQAPLKYPETRKSGQVDDYFGTSVADPYRWLENTNDPEVREWIDAENTLTFSYLATIPERPMIRQRLATLWDYAREGIPIRREKTYFYSYNTRAAEPVRDVPQASRTARRRSCSIRTR